MAGRERSLDLGLIGNCQIAALIDRDARIVWECWPRFDGDPVFCELLRGEQQTEAGFFAVDVRGGRTDSRQYVRNTPILETVIRAADGAAVRIIDFCPRFREFGRMFRPAMTVRIVEPIAGRPVVRVRMQPTRGYGRELAPHAVGSNHLRYELDHGFLRMTTSAALTHVVEEHEFLLDSPIHFIIGPDEPLTEAPDTLARRFLELTQHYWVDWVRTLAIPFDWQEAVIRAAITLKLCSFEDTGAIVAAHTTSIPESAGSGRNWDYRFCWLRDAYFVVQALNRLGVTGTMEEYLRYIFSIVATRQGEALQPVYGISGEARLTEEIVSSLNGYRDMGPVRRGNQAYEQIQHDVYGSVVMAATQAFFDYRLAAQESVALFERLERLGESAVAASRLPDAGIWEFRGSQLNHTFSSVMCWAACDRLSRIATRIGLAHRAVYWRDHAAAIRSYIESSSWSQAERMFSATWPGVRVDASLLVLHDLGFLEAKDPRFESTVAAVERVLRRGPYMMRYAVPDDFGDPHNAFNICTFWFINALASLGRRDEAIEVFEAMLARRNSLGLLSEDTDTQTGELWGNFPQTYSMVGIINCATRLSRNWEDML